MAAHTGEFLHLQEQPPPLPGIQGSLGNPRISWRHKRKARTSTGMLPRPALASKAQPEGIAANLHRKPVISAYSAASGRQALAWGLAVIAPS